MADAQNEQLERLIAQIAKGDRAAFETFYDMTSARIHALCVMMLNDRPAAEETLQDVYVAVWKQSHNFVDFKLQPMTWLIDITRNRALSRLRNARRSERRPDTKPVVQLTAPTQGDAEGSAILRPDQGPLARLDMERLQNLREIYLRGLTYDDLAARNGSSPRTEREMLKSDLLGLPAEFAETLSPAQADQLLAAELVLGLLDEETTEATLNRKADEPDLRAIVGGWKENLAPLTAGLTPIMAPARARQRTRETLGLIAAPLAEDPNEQSPRYLRRLMIALLALAAAAGLAYIW